jgi:hypothetical protein
MNFNAKTEQVLNRQLEVQTLSIPFTVTANATPSLVTVVSDEPSLLFFRTSGTDQITAELAPGETATYSIAANDASGIMNVLVEVNEPIVKVVYAKVTSTTSALTTFQAAYLGSATGITTGSGGGNNIMLNVASTVDLATTNLVACLEVGYITQE